MDKNQKYQILKYSLLFLLLIFALLLWWSVDRAIFVEGASVWLAPIVWSSLFFIDLSLAVILIKERNIFLLAIATSFFTSLIFVFSVFYVAILILSSLFILMADGRIRTDFEERLKIDLGKNVRSGSAFIIFALSLVIATQYYFATKDLATEKYLPRFEVGEQMNGLILKVVANFMPQVKGLENPNLTVDQFLLEMYEKQKAGSGSISSLEAQLEALDDAQRLLIEGTVRDAEGNMALTEGRKQLSQIALREVGGDEKISDVFSEMVNKKINSYFIPGSGKNERSPLFSAVIAIIIFLTAMSLGSFLLRFWIWLIMLLFFVLKQSGAIAVVRVPAEKEVIA